MKHAKAEKVAKVRETYRKEYTNEERKANPNATEEEIAAKVDEKMRDEAAVNSEIVGNVVAELLGSEKFLKRYAQMGEEQSSVVKRIARFVKGIANALKEKDEEAGAIATKMMELVDRALGSEVSGEKTGTKYSVIQKDGVYYTPTDEEIIKNHPTINGVIINNAEYSEGHTLPDDEYKAYRKSQAEKARKVVGTYTNKDTTYSDEYGLITAEFKTPAIRKGKSYGGIALYDILPYVPQIFENAVVINTKPDSEANTNIKGIVNLVGCAILNNKYVAVVKLNVKEYANDEAKIYDNRVIEIEELTVVERVDHQEAKTSSDSTSSAVSSKYIIAKFREFVKNNDEKKSLTDSDIKNSTEQYDLDPEAVEREAKKNTPHQSAEQTASPRGEASAKKANKAKAESSTSGIKTGSAEAGRYARGMRYEFGLDKKFEAAIRSKLESLEEVFIKGDRESYVEEYKKRVEEIFDIVRREGVVEVATDNSYRGFQTYMRGKKFRVDKRFRQNMGKEEWKGVYSVIRGRLTSDFHV